mgnify:CR=1 FL=1
MIEKNIEHEYEYEDGCIVDCFGHKMDRVDEYVEELNMLMDEIRRLKRENING